MLTCCQLHTILYNNRNWQPTNNAYKVYVKDSSGICVGLITFCVRESWNNLTQMNIHYLYMREWERNRKKSRKNVNACKTKWKSIKNLSNLLHHSWNSHASQVTSVSHHHNSRSALRINKSSKTQSRCCKDDFSGTSFLFNVHLFSLPIWHSGNDE